MTLCPVALAVGCKKCPIFSICPVKRVIGDYTPSKAVASEDATPGKASAKPPSGKKTATGKAG